MSEPWLETSVEIERAEHRGPSKITSDDGTCASIGNMARVRVSERKGNTARRPFHFRSTFQHMRLALE